MAAALQTAQSVRVCLAPTPAATGRTLILWPTAKYSSCRQCRFVALCQNYAGSRVMDDAPQISARPRAVPAVCGGATRHLPAAEPAFDLDVTAEVAHEACAG